jgi:hypothetical protein
MKHARSRNRVRHFHYTGEGGHEDRGQSYFLPGNAGGHGELANTGLTRVL